MDFDSAADIAVVPSSPGQCALPVMYPADLLSTEPLSISSPRLPRDQHVCVVPSKLTVARTRSLLLGLVRSKGRCPHSALDWPPAMHAGLLKLPPSRAPNKSFVMSIRWPLDGREGPPSARYACRRPAVQDKLPVVSSRLLWNTMCEISVLPLASASPA